MERFGRRAARRIRERIEREDPPDPDIHDAIAYARRLELDPFDAPFTRDHETGQFWVRIETAQRVGTVLVETQVANEDLDDRLGLTGPVCGLGLSATTAGMLPKVLLATVASLAVLAAGCGAPGDDAGSSDNPTIPADNDQTEGEDGGDDDPVTDFPAGEEAVPVDARGSFLVRISVSDETATALASSYLGAVLGGFEQVSPVQIDGTMLTVLVSNVSEDATSALTFGQGQPASIRPVVSDTADATDPDSYPSPNGGTILLGPAASGLSAAFIADAQAVFEPAAGWTVDVQLTPEGTTALADLTARCAAFAADCPTGRMAVVAGGEVVLDARVQSPIDGGEFVVTGEMDQTRAQFIASALLAGQLEIDSVTTQWRPPTFTAGASTFAAADPIPLLADAVSRSGWFTPDSYAGEPAEVGEFAVAGVFDAEGSFIAFYSFAPAPDGSWEIETVVGDANEACASLSRSPQVAEMLPSFAEKTGCVEMSAAGQPDETDASGLDDPFELAALLAQDELAAFCTSSAFGELMDSAVADAIDDRPSTTSVDGPSGPAYPCRYSAQYEDFTVFVQIGFSFGNAPAVVRSNTLEAFARLGATVITDEPGEDRWMVTFDSQDRLLGDQTQVGIKVQSASLLIGVEVLPKGDGYIASEAVARRVEAALPELAARAADTPGAQAGSDECDPAKLYADMGPQAAIKDGLCTDGWALLTNSVVARLDANGTWTFYTAFPSDICRDDAAADGVPAVFFEAVNWPTVCR